MDGFISKKALLLPRYHSGTGTIPSSHESSNDWPEHFIPYYRHDDTIITDSRRSHYCSDSKLRVTEELLRETVLPCSLVMYSFVLVVITVARLWGEEGVDLFSLGQPASMQAGRRQAGSSATAADGSCRVDSPLDTHTRRVIAARSSAPSLHSLVTKRPVCTAIASEFPSLVCLFDRPGPHFCLEAHRKNNSFVDG